MLALFKKTSSRGLKLSLLPAPALCALLRLFQKRQFLFLLDVNINKKYRSGTLGHYSKITFFN